ncbi:MAG TPA: histidine kinase dimerization/phosphoacceptor domain -containing protein [Polyangiales bacterium]|nr:histidine kinase dimerization/phosphoacceptor domain -containing protein [Polyangiales bacterium]
MQTPSVPPHERERLECLAKYEIVDSGPDAAFDGLTALAAHILDMPIVLVSIVDAHRQWFKSRHGLTTQETPRELSFCGHVVSQGSAMVVPDALADPRFADNPLVTGDPHVRFYAGTPLRTHDGFVLGTLCAIDHAPRELSAEQLRLLDILAHQVSAQLELRRRNLELEAQDRKQQQLQERLRGSLREKDVLLQEVHHRVKNNLQLISSLINLQMALLPKGGESRNALEECQGRIHAVAIVHEAIYSARDYARVPIATYVRSLASSICHAFGASTREIGLELEIGELQLPVDKAIPCGLILNELISNALKHAFPPGRPGVVRVQVAELPDARLQAVVADDGVGLPAGFSAEACSSVGMQVVCALVEQLEAQLQVLQGGAGTQFIVTFPLEA